MICNDMDAHTIHIITQCNQNMEYEIDHVFSENAKIKSHQNVTPYSGRYHYLITTKEYSPTTPRIQNSLQIYSRYIMKMHVI